MLIFAPLAAYIPRTALAGVLIVTAYGMIDRHEIVRIWRGARADAVIMVVTFLSTLLLHLEFAVLTGILFSFAMYIMKTSVPEVTSVLPDDQFEHFSSQPEKPPCPQLVILDVLGDLYFGAVAHVEDKIRQHLAEYPQQRYLLLRMHSVDNCDFSGIHALEAIVRTYRELDGDVFFVRVREPIMGLMEATEFYEHLGADHFLTEDEAITHIFYRVMDPAICIYECDVRAFKECQNLPKQTLPLDAILHTDVPDSDVPTVAPTEVWASLCSGDPPHIVDVREPREFARGRVPQAEIIPLPKLLSEEPDLPRDCPVVLVCQGGRRSTRAAAVLRGKGYSNVSVLRGGMQAWHAADLLEALEECDALEEC
jgi:SulP family sulfate permease